MKFKRGVDRRLTPSMAYWMGRIESRFLHWFGTEPTCTSAFRESSRGAHSRGEAFDLRRVDEEEIYFSDEEEFCRSIQNDFGDYLGVVLEPEWGRGKGFTGPHFHFQLKRRGRCFE